MPRPDPRLLALIDAHAAGRGTISDRVFAALWRIWSGFDGWYRPSLVDEVSHEAWDAVSTGQAATAGLTDAYMSGMTTLVRGRPTSTVGVSPDMRGTLRAGVTGPQVQARVASEFRWQIYRGVDPDTALDVAANRAREAASQDLNLAFRQQVAGFTEKRKVTQFRRVTRGEGVCGLCVAASNQIYTRGDLLPIHARCRCSVVEVDSVMGGGRVASDAEYRALAGASRSLSAKDLKDVRYAVDEHGELGPVLRNATQRVSGVDRQGLVDAKGPKTPERKILDPASRVSTMTVAEADKATAIAEKSLAFARKNNLDQQIEWHTKRLRFLDARIAALAS